MVQYSTALSHLILVGTGFYCFKALNTSICKLSYGIVAFHSLLGLWRWGNPSYGHKTDTLYRLTSKLQDLLVLPCIVTTLWLKYNYSFNLACAHTIVSLVPFLLYLYDKRKNEPIDAFLGGNLLSLLVVSCMNSNYYGVTTSLSYFLSYFIIKRDLISNFSIEVPVQDLFNYSMCFFVVFARNAILDPV